MLEANGVYVFLSKKLTEKHAILYLFVDAIIVSEGVVMEMKKFIQVNKNCFDLSCSEFVELLDSLELAR